MKDFNYYAPTEVVFGKESEEQVAALVKKYGGTKVLVHYGGQSAVRSGLLDKICGLLQEGGIAYVTLGGVVPNPRLSLAQGLHSRRGWRQRDRLVEVHRLWCALRRQRMGLLSRQGRASGHAARGERADHPCRWQ